MHRKLELGAVEAVKRFIQKLPGLAASATAERPQQFGATEGDVGLAAHFVAVRKYTPQKLIEDIGVALVELVAGRLEDLDIACRWQPGSFAIQGPLGVAAVEPRTEDCAAREGVRRHEVIVQSVLEWQLWPSHRAGVRKCGHCISIVSSRGRPTDGRKYRRGVAHAGHAGTCG